MLTVLKVPTEVKDELVIPDANVVPDRLAAGIDPAVTVPTVVIEADPAIGEYVVPAAVVVKYVFVSTESNPVAEVLTNPAVGSAPRVMVEVDFPITIGFMPVPATPIFIVPVVKADPPILIEPVDIFVNNVAVVPVADAAFITSIVGVVIVGDDEVIIVPEVGRVIVVAPEVVNIKEFPVVERGTVYLVVEGE